MALAQDLTRKLQRHPNRFFQDYQEKLEAVWTEETLKKILEKFSSAQSLQDWQDALAYYNEFQAHLQTHFSLIELAFQRDTENAEIEKEEKRLHEEIEPVVETISAEIRQKILHSPFLNELHKKFSDQFFTLLQIQQDSFHPQNIPLETELNNVMSDYTKLTGGAFFEVDQKKYPLAHYKKFAVSPDENLRRQAFQSYAGWFIQNRDALEKIYDEAVQLRDRMGKNLGHANFIPLAYQKMRRTDYGPEEVQKFRQQIQEVMVPLSSKILAAQAKLLGKNKISVWDTSFFKDWQNGELKVAVDQQVPTALKIYEQLSPQLGQHFRKMMDANLIDVEARLGKAPGAFCTDFGDYRTPFIFLNSVNEASDVTTMLHECGHSFQAWESSKIDLMELRWPTLDACEVHSMSMEFLAYPYYEEFFTPQDADNYRKRHLAESILIIPYIAMVDEFQHLVYSGQAVGKAGRGSAWKKLVEKYSPGIDYSEIPEWMECSWIRQLHIFRAPFYYIDYAIAQVGAWQLWAMSTRDKDQAMQNYLNLCRLGGTLPLKEFFSSGKLKLPFESGMLQKLMDEVLEIQPLL